MRVLGVKIVSVCERYEDRERTGVRTDEVRVIRSKLVVKLLSMWLVDVVP